MGEREEAVGACWVLCGGRRARQRNAASASKQASKQATLARWMINYTHHLVGGVRPAPLSSNLLDAGPALCSAAVVPFLLLLIAMTALFSTASPSASRSKSRATLCN